MSEFTLAAFGGIAAALFVTELTDKDAFLLIAVSTKVKAAVAFLAGTVAFVFNTALIVTTGSLLIYVVPVYWVRLAGGVVMIFYGLWEARGLVGMRTVAEESSRIPKSGTNLRVFVGLVGTLILLDLAGDATMILTIVFVARYQNALLVFSGACTGLLCAAGLETALGSRLGRFLTPGRLRLLSAGVFLIIGVSIILLSV